MLKFFFSSAGQTRKKSNVSEWMVQEVWYNEGLLSLRKKKGKLYSIKYFFMKSENTYLIFSFKQSGPPPTPPTHTHTRKKEHSYCREFFSEFPLVQYITYFIQKYSVWNRFLFTIRIHCITKESCEQTQTNIGKYISCCIQTRKRILKKTCTLIIFINKNFINLNFWMFTPYTCAYNFMGENGIFHKGILCHK